MNTDLYRVTTDFWKSFPFPETRNQPFSTPQAVSHIWGSISYFPRKVILLLLYETMQALPDKHTKSSQYTLSIPLRQSVCRPCQPSQPWLSGIVVDVFHCRKKSMSPDNLSLYFWCHWAFTMKWLHSSHRTAKARERNPWTTAVKRPHSSESARSWGSSSLSLWASNNFIESSFPFAAKF